jgi:hypothetical protein
VAGLANSGEVSAVGPVRRRASGGDEDVAGQPLDPVGTHAIRSVVDSVSAARCSLCGQDWNQHTPSSNRSGPLDSGCRDGFRSGRESPWAVDRLMIGLDPSGA